MRAILKNKIEIFLLQPAKKEINIFHKRMTFYSLKNLNSNFDLYSFVKLSSVWIERHFCVLCMSN